MKRAARRFAAVLALPLLSAYASAKSAPRIPVDLYVMSQCPFGVQAENALLPAIKALKDHVDFNLYFIGGESSDTAKQLGVAFTSLHGPSEVEENRRQLCARDLYPKSYLDYILERNKGYKDLEWRPAAERAKIDPAKIDACMASPASMQRYSKNLAAHRARQAFASPTIDIAGKPYQGARTQRSMALAICQEISARGGALPQACKDAESLPADPISAQGSCGPGGQDRQPNPALGGSHLDFNIRIVIDPDCPACEPTLEDSLRNQHPSARIERVSSKTQEGQGLIRKFEAEALPLYILDGKVEQDAMFKQQLSRFYQKKHDAYLLRPGPSTYWPTVHLKRAREPNHLDIFVESLSHFSVQAESELIQFLQKTDSKDLSLSFHYLAQESARADDVAAPKGSKEKVRAAKIGEMKEGSVGALTSLRGEQELQEDVRQICLFQHAPIGTFFTYLSCRNQNIHDPALGDRCLELNNAVKQCIEGPEGRELIRRDSRFAREIGIAGGPAIFWENRYGPFGWNQVNLEELISGRK